MQKMDTSYTERKRNVDKYELKLTETPASDFLMEQTMELLDGILEYKAMMMPSDLRVRMGQRS